MLRALVLAWIAGWALAESGPPHETGAVAFLFGAALMVAVDPLVAQRSVGRASLVGGFAGLGFGASALRWIAPALAGFAPEHAWLAWPAVIAVSALSALAPALGCGLYVAGARERGDALRFAMAMAIAFGLVPMVFPYRPIAMALPLRSAGAWLGVGGPTLADFVVTLPLCAVVAAATRGDRHALGRALGLLAAILGAGEFESWRVEHARAAAPSMRLGVVQSDVSIASGRDREQRGARLERLRVLTRGVVTQGVDAVLWPESSYPFAIDRGLDHEPSPPRDVGARRLGVTIAVGATTVVDRCAHWNGVVVFDGLGHAAGLSDKQRRMPFADASPHTLLVRSGESLCGELAPARRVEPLGSLGGAGALVCYDEVEPWVARARANAGATYLVGFTNDVWYRGTRQPGLHERMARMRAVETGRDLVRVVNGGPSSHVAASGRLVARVGEGGERAFVAEVRLLRAPSLYALVGSLVEVVFVVLFVVSGLQRRNTSSSGGGR